MFLRQDYDVKFLIKAEIVIPQNDVQAIDEALKQIHVGGITVFKVKGRGKSIGPSIHASKGMRYSRLNSMTSTFCRWL